jgi:hypothetical protein
LTRSALDVALGHLEQLVFGFFFAEAGDLLEVFLLLGADGAQVVFEVVEVGLVLAQLFGARSSSSSFWSRLAWRLRSCCSVWRGRRVFAVVGEQFH